MNPDPIPASFGAWVRARRRQLDLTQAELGQRAGCSEAAIRKIEADERKPSRELAELLAGALHIPPAEREEFLRFARGILTGEIKASPPLTANNLPSLLTSTVNRTQALSELTGLLTHPNARLVTLVGPPGIGKTRLSVECGYALLENFPDGIWFVDLAEVVNPDFFIPTLARSIPSRSLPPSPTIAHLLGELGGKSTLLILDNFEQIVEKSALEVAQILKTCPRVKILVTSRAPLQIYGEHEYPLPPLSIPPPNAEKTQAGLMQFEAVQLFVTRTRQHQPHFVITPQNAPAIIEICAIMEGIPLALELAAASLRQMTLDEMLQLLRSQDWVSQISTPARDLPQRQRTLEHVIAWSYNLLDDRQKQGFSRLGVFSSWFDLEAAANICELDAAAARHLLNALSNHSLLVRGIFAGKHHWRMLELIHAYAGARLTPEGRTDAERRKAQHFLQRLDTLPQSPAERDSFFNINHSNLSSSLAWAIDAQQTGLAYQLSRFLDEKYWSEHGYFREGLEMLRKLLELPGDIPPALRAQRLQTASDFAWQQHDFETAILYCREAAELGRVHDLKQQYPLYLNRLGRIYVEQEHYAEAKEALQEALDQANDHPEYLNPGIPLAQLGEVALFEGRVEEAQSHLRRAIDEI
ncbi:MAG: helix-turn-helix domain-containing protein, partial [Chloroflexi bacterium]|nr:helix-turn-helix domain-containing protein [Chloroflexota bacterium]